MEDSNGILKALSVEFVPMLKPFSCFYDGQSRGLASLSPR
jgi:hypothetical protein